MLYSVGLLCLDCQQALENRFEAFLAILQGELKGHRQKGDWDADRHEQVILSKNVPSLMHDSSCLSRCIVKKYYKKRGTEEDMCMTSQLQTSAWLALNLFGKHHIMNFILSVISANAKLFPRGPFHALQSLEQHKGVEEKCLILNT